MSRSRSGSLLSAACNFELIPSEPRLQTLGILSSHHSSVNRRCARAAFSAVILYFFFLFAAAEGQSDPAAGLPMFSTQLPGGLYESIDPATSNIYVQIPVRNKNGKIPFSYKLALNSHAVVTEYCSHLGEYTWWVSPVANNSCNASPSGGNFSGSQPFGVKVPDPTSAPATVNCNGIKYQYNVWTNFSIVDATGVTHSVPGMRIYTNYPKACTNPVPTATGVTTDGSGFSLVASADTAPWATVYDKSGNEIQPQTGDAAIVTDPDGTTLTAAVTNTAFAYTDALDATVPVLAIPNQQGGWGVPAVYEYTDAAGNTQSLTVNSTPYTQQTAFGCSGIQDIPPVADTYLPSSIVTPAGTITLSYETTPGDTHNPHYVTGRLAGITYPTGASVSYAYSGGNSGIYCTVA